MFKMLHGKEFQRRGVETFDLVRIRCAILSTTAQTGVQVDPPIWLYKAFYQTVCMLHHISTSPPVSINTLTSPPSAPAVEIVLTVTAHIKGINA